MLTLLHFAGKVALVTGGSSGIGRATALAFARGGAQVVAADVDAAGGEETVRLIKDAGNDALFVQTDVSRAVDVEAMVTQTVATYDRVDCTCNNAGIAGPLAPLADYTKEAWDRVIAINLTGVWLCMKYEILAMRHHGGGAMVNIASVMGLVATPRGPAYTASKHGVVGLTKSAALAYAQVGIRINAICPGYIRSPMTEHFFTLHPEREGLTIARHPIGRLGTPEGIAVAVLWLCSDAASFVTGHTMTVDGGYVAQ